MGLRSSFLKLHRIFNHRNSRDLIGRTEENQSYHENRTLLGLVGGKKRFWVITVKSFICQLKNSS